MDPLWLLVVLVGLVTLVIAAGIIIVAVAVRRAAREAAPKLQQIQQQVTELQAEVIKVLQSTEASEAKFDEAATKIGALSERVTGVMDKVTRVEECVENAGIRATATVRAISKVGRRTVEEMRKRSAAAREITLDDQE